MWSLNTSQRHTAAAYCGIWKTRRPPERADTPNALANGTVDAVMTFQPYINQIQSLLNGQTAIWPGQADQYGYFESICTKTWASAHPDLITRFLKALIQAEDFNILHRDQAVAMVAKDLNFTEEYAASDWPSYQYSVTLDQSLLSLMNDEARWLINNNLTTASSIPDFLSYVYVAGLKSVKPEAVNIIG